MSKFQIYDVVESEFFTDLRTITNIAGNAAYAVCSKTRKGDWFLEKQLELVKRGVDLKSVEAKYTGTGSSDDPIRLVGLDILKPGHLTTVGGVKHDQGKPDLSLLPREALEAMAQAFMYGAKKYGRYNYKAGMEWHRPLAAALRHIVAFTAGEDKDPESGLSHLGHAMAAVAMVTVYQAQSVGKDTRHKP